MLFEVLNKFNDLGGVLLGIDLGVFVDHLALVVQNKGPAGRGFGAQQCHGGVVNGGFEGAALTRGYAEEFCDEAVDIGHEWKIQCVGLFKELEVVHGVSTDTHDVYVELLQGFCAVPVRAGLLGATAGHGCRVKIDRQILTLALMG